MPPATKPPLSAATAEFGRRVRELRYERGLTQEKLAEKAGMHWTFVGQVERGQRNLTLHNILKLAEALDSSPGQLADGIPSPRSS